MNKLLWSRDFITDYVAGQTAEDKREILIYEFDYDPDLLAEISDEQIMEIFENDPDLFDHERVDFEQNFLPVLESQTRDGYIILEQLENAYCLRAGDLILYINSLEQDGKYFLTDVGKIYNLPIEDIDFKVFIKNCCYLYVADQKAEYENLTEDDILENFIIEFNHNPEIINYYCDVNKLSSTLERCKVNLDLQFEDDDEQVKEENK